MTNNDRFKFRCWDNERAEYIDFGWNPDYGLELDFKTGKLMWQSVPDGEDEYPKELDTKELVIEQCTGLKDKNGNLIYEGDIIHDLGDIEPVCGLSLVVRWSDRTAGFYLDHQKIGMRAYLGRLDSADSHNYEIVGNIHEQKDK